MLRAGSLNKKIQIMKIEYTTNAYGERSKAYIERTSTRASVSPYTGNESFSDGISNTISHKITVNGRIVVSPTDIIIYDGRTFNIEYIMNWGEANREKMILAVEKIEENA